jgi:hypothetical protein
MEFITDHRENVMAHMTEQYLVHYAQTATKHYRLPDEVYDDEHLVGSDANDTDIDNILALLDVKNKIKYRPQQPPQ